MPSASCCFFHVFYITGNQYQTKYKCHETESIFYGPKGRQWALVAPGGCPEGGTTHQGAPGGPGPWWVVLTSGAPRTASLLYKYPNIQKTLGESTKINSSRHKFQNHEVPSGSLFRHSVGGRFDHGGGSTSPLLPFNDV